MEFTDRYKALGIPYPDPKTICEGHCEGTGVIPIFGKIQTNAKVYPEIETDPILLALWQEMEDANPSTDGWHFVTCPDCGGTGKQSGIKQLKKATGRQP